MTKKVTITRREIDAALSHASTDTTRANINSVRVSRKEGWTRIEATDGRRVIRVQRYEPEAPAEYDEMLSPPDLKAASKLITGAAANPNGRGANARRSFALSEKDSHENLKVGVVPEVEGVFCPEASATVRTVAGAYPNTDMVFPDVDADRNDYVRVSINPEFLIDAARALSKLCTTKEFNTIQLHVKRENSAKHPIVLTGQHHENGTRGTVVIMPVRDSEGVIGAPYPERETDQL